MFYSQFILAKKGPLGTIWIAAHLERKLRKNQVAETNIGVSVDSILFPEVPIALRLSGHLLLGVVRIYSKKVNYLFHDCSEALVKIKQAFHSTIVDLPPEAATAPFHSITLPETFDFDELELLQDPESSFVQSNGNFVDHNVTTREQITLQDPMEDIVYPGSSQFGLDERFVDGDSSPIGLDFDEDIFTEKLVSPVLKPSSPALKEDFPPSTSGHGDEAVRMDMDDRHEPSTPIVHIDRTERDEPMRTSGIEQIRADQQQNLSSLSPPLNHLDESVMTRASSKDPDVVLSGDAMLSFNVLLPHTQQVFEARTPDLNKEFCPPDEPSTPALPEETSLPFEQELPLISGSQERLFPSSSGGVERAKPDEKMCLGPPTNQVSVISPLGQSRQDVVVPAQPALQICSVLCGSDQSRAAMDFQQVSMAQQEQLSNTSIPQNETLSFPDQSFKLNPVQKPSSEINREASVNAFQGFHQPASMQQPPPVGIYCQPGQDSAVPALFSLPMMDQNLSNSACSEQSRAAMYPQQVSMPSQGQLSSMLTSQNASSSFFNQSVRLNPVEQASYIETDRDASFTPFKGFSLSPSMQQLAGSYHQSRQDFCVPSQFSSSITEERFTPFVGLQKSNAVIYPQQANMMSRPHLNSMSVMQKTLSSFTDQSSVTNPVQKASLVEQNRDTISAPFQGFPLPASLRQLMTGSYQNISLGTSNYLAPLAATNGNHSMASLHQPFGRPSAALSHSWSSSMPNHDASSIFQQPGLLTNPKAMLPMLMPNSATSVNHALASSIGTAESSSIFQRHGTIWDQRVNMTDSIKKPFQSMPGANNLPSSLTSSGSFSPPAQDSSTLAQTEGTVLNTETQKPLINQELFAIQRSQEVSFTKENILSTAAQQQMSLQGTHELAVTRENVSHAATQQFVTSLASSLAFNVPSFSGIEKDQEQVAIQRIQEPAAIKEMPLPPVILHHVESLAASLPPSLPSVFEREESQRNSALHMRDIPQGETLRSTAEALREEPGFFSLRNDETSRKIPAVELDRNNAHAAKNNERLKEVIHHTLDKTPSLREETPNTATKRSPFSTRSFNSVPGDDDVLATILGRGTSAFKVLPTPKENPVAKRPRVVLRSSFKKRKIDFDILTVLHGDVIRQQLANTEDIRRVRKKAPCTRREIWSLNREIQGQQLFCEPSLPGLSTSLHELYLAVFGVNGAKLPSAGLPQTTQDLLVGESENSRLLVEDRIGDSSRLIFEGLKENNSSDFPSAAVCPPEKMVLEESVVCSRRDDELTARVMTESLNRALNSQDLCVPLQHREEVALQIGSVHEPTSVCDAELVHIMPLEMEAREYVSQNGSQPPVGDLDLQGSICREREENIDNMEKKTAEKVFIENDVGQGLVDPVIFNLMDVGKERNISEAEVNKEIEVIPLQGDIGLESQGLIIHSEEEMQRPRTDAQCAQVFESFGTGVLGRKIDLQSLQTIPVAKEDVFSRQVHLQSLLATPFAKEDVFRRQVDLQSLQTVPVTKEDVFSRQVDLQSLPAIPVAKEDVFSRQVHLQSLQTIPVAKEDVFSRQVDLQSLAAIPVAKEDGFSRQVDLQSLQSIPVAKEDVFSRQVDLQCLQAIPVAMKEDFSRQVDLQSLQAIPNEKQDVLSRQLDLQSLEATPNETQDVLSRLVDLQTLQATPNEKQDVLSREADLQSVQTVIDVQQGVLSREIDSQFFLTTPGVLSREVDLQSLQTTPGAKQDVLDVQVYLQSLQTTLGAQQDVVHRQINLQSLQTTPGAEQDLVEIQSLSNSAMLETTPGTEQDVVEVPSFSNSAIVVKGDDKEMIGDILEKRLDASKEDREFAFISDPKVTEFLADDVTYDEVDGFADCASDELDSSIHDNNGWSARTRNVGRYLKIVFEGMEVNSKRSGGQGNPTLGLGRLLMGKTRKEAARMFFETLVLKTREYIHVEQKNAFEDIHLYPSPKLMKTSF